MHNKNTNDITVGSLVTVGPCYTYGGTYEADRWTGQTLRVVALRQGSGPPSAALAPANLLGVDESDEVVEVVLRRLTPATAVGGPRCAYYKETAKMGERCRSRRDYYGADCVHCLHDRGPQ